MEEHFFIQEYRSDFEALVANMGKWAYVRGLKTKVLCSAEKAQEKHQASQGRKQHAEAVVVVYEGLFNGIKFSYQSTQLLTLEICSRFMRGLEWLTIATIAGVILYGLVGSAQRLFSAGLPDDGIGVAMLGLFTLLLLPFLIGGLLGAGVYIFGLVVFFSHALLNETHYSEDVLQQIWKETVPLPLTDEEKTKQVQTLLDEGEKEYTAMYGNRPGHWSECKFAMYQAEQLAGKYGLQDWGEEIRQRFDEMRAVHDSQFKGY